MTRGGCQDVFASEVLKLITLRAVWVSCLVMVVLPVGLAALSAPGIGDAIATSSPDLAPGTTAEVVGLELLALGQIGAILIGVVAGSNEYDSAQIKTSLVAVPRRGLLAVTKTAAVALVTCVTAVIAVPSVSLVSQLGMGTVGVLGDGLPLSLVGRWLGGIAFWVGMALIAFAFGLVVRRTLLPMFTLVLVSQLSLVLVLLTSWSKWLPTVAGVQLFDAGQVSGSFPEAQLSGAAAIISFTAWVAGSLVIAGAVFLRRDIRQ